MRRFVCLLLGHEWRHVDMFDSLEVRECKRCKEHLNTHHGLGQAFTSKEFSMLPEIRKTKRFFREKEVIG